jgi:hypothetical protein
MADAITVLRELIDARDALEAQRLDTWSRDRTQRVNDAMTRASKADAEARRIIAGVLVLDQPRHDDGSPAPEDSIAKAKRILRAVDIYNEAPNAPNRTELRRVIHAQLEAAASGVQGIDSTTPAPTPAAVAVSHPPRDSGKDASNG